MENKVSRHNSQFELKINYLQEENKLLKDRIQDLEEIIKLNKKAFERSLTLENMKQKPNSKSKPFFSKSSEEQAKYLKEINDELTKENTYLNLKIEKLIKERDIANDKALVSDQVANEFKRLERETTADYKNEISNLKKKIEEKEKKIKEIQNGGIFRIKNVVSPEEKSLLFHSEIEGLKYRLSKTLKKYFILQTQKEELIKLNQQFFNEIIKMKELLSLQPKTSFSGKTTTILSHQTINMFSATNQTLNLLDFHRKFYKIDISDENSLEEISPLHSPLPLKIEPINCENKKQQDIPKLDINKALLIQEMNINEKKKNNGSELPQREVVLNATTIAERIKKIEAELKRNKKILQQEMLDNQMLKSQLNKFEEEIKNLRVKNKTLVEAQKNFETKWKKMGNLLAIYKQSYRANSKQLSNFNRISHNRNKSENNYNFLCANLPSANKFSLESFGISNNNDQLSTDEINRDFDFLETRIREQLMTDKEGRKVVNLSLIDSEECKNEDFSERGQYIKFLQNMGIYLNQIYNTSRINSIKNKRWRSNSLVFMGESVNKENFNKLIMKQQKVYHNEKNKYTSFKSDLKEAMLKYFPNKPVNDMPNPRLERNLISPVSKPNDNERGFGFMSSIRQNHNHTLSLPFQMTIKNLGSEEFFS